MPPIEDTNEPPKSLLGIDDDEPPKSLLGLNDDFKTEADDEHSPDVRSSLEQAESLVTRARQVSEALFKEAYRMPEYKRVLATRDRCAQFEEKLLRTARLIDSRLGTGLPADALNKVVRRLANSVAIWDHSPPRQRVRQRKQVAKRRKKNRGRDLRIVRLHEDGWSQRRIAAEYKISRGAVRNILARAAVSSPR